MIANTKSCDDLYLQSFCLYIVNMEIKVGKIYRCKSNGKLYRVEQDHLLCKTIVNSKRIYTADSFEVEFEDSYEWDKVKDRKMVLYKALYECTDGPFFVRYKDDFEKKFEEYTENNNEEKK